MASDVQKVSSEIVEVLQLIMSESTPPEVRKLSHEQFDTFKDSSPLCAKCGIFLAVKSNPPIVRHCGLQLVDNYIKLHWNEIAQDEKIFIKNSILQTVANGTESVTKEESYIKDAVSKIIVELIKREWPQQWPSLMDELNSLCCMGDEQTELILLIFSRLADDIVQFQNVQEKRRKEIYKTLCTHLNDLFAFFWKTLSENCVKYFNGQANGLNNEEVLRSCRIAKVTLETLSTFVDWVPINFIVGNNDLIKLLCKLLGFENLRMPAVMCLLNILERKGKPDERKMLLVFFEESALFNFGDLDFKDECHYLFLKVLFQCFLSLVTNLCFSLAQFDFPVPQNFSNFICAILSKKQPSLVITQTAQALWLNILKSQQLFSTVQNILPQLMVEEAEKFLKSGYPSKSDSIVCKFSLIEFDSDDEFETAFHKSRADAADIIRLIAKKIPFIAFRYCCQLLDTLLSGHDWKTILYEPIIRIDKVMCWEAMVSFIDAVCGTLQKSIEHPEFKIVIPEGVKLLKAALDFTSEDAVILSFELSTISSLFFFINYCPELRLKAINKIFSNFACFKKENLFSKDVMNLRRHASSLLIKLSCNHPTLLLPEFEYMCKLVQDLFQSNDCLTHFDKCALLESLIILSNSFNNFQKQSDFLTAVLSSTFHIWLSPTIMMGIESPEAFISFISIDQPYIDLNEGPLNKNALELMYAMNVVKACAKRCICPNDPDVAKNGGFIHPLSNSFGLFYRNPAAQHILPVLGKVIQLLKTLNALHDPVIKLKFHESYSKILDICEGDKNNILGLPYSDHNIQPRTASDRVKLYIQGLYDGCLNILGNSVENFSIDFYTVPDLPSLVKGSIFHKVEYLPSMCLRSLIRLFLRPFFLCCPASAYDELMTVLAGFCPFMLQKLSTNWEKFKLRYGTSIGYEEQQTEVEEILEDQLNRLLSKEYIIFLVDLLSKKHTSSLNDDSIEDDAKEQVNTHLKTLTVLGIKIVQTESVRPIFICTAFDALRWLDTTTNLKAVQMCELLFSKLIEDGLIQQIQEANYLLQSVLYGLQELGEHDANLAQLMALAITVYEKLRKHIPDIRETLMSSVDCSCECIQKLDEYLLKNQQKTKNDKQKKEVFRNVINKIIGRNIGQHHKREVIIKNLPPLINLKPKENSSLLDVEVNDDIGLCNLFVASRKGRSILCKNDP